MKDPSDSGQRSALRRDQSPLHAQRWARNRPREKATVTNPTPAVARTQPKRLAINGAAVSIAFLALLERLGPEERAAFLLHDVFDYDYPEVAKIVGKPEPTCRQMIHRARLRVRDSRPRHSVTAESREHILLKFLSTVATGDRIAVMALLAEDVEYMADGGGKAIAALKILRGPERLGWLYHCMDGRVFSVLSFVIDGDERVSRIYNVRNPDKLIGVALRDLAV
jgi:RNA polymerase sigma-70 factor (ECF subfamily)